MLKLSAGGNDFLAGSYLCTQFKYQEFKVIELL
jgi:hypothetical protein